MYYFLFIFILITVGYSPTTVGIDIRSSKFKILKVSMPLDCDRSVRLLMNSTKPIQCLSTFLDFIEKDGEDYTMMFINRNGCYALRYLCATLTPNSQTRLYIPKKNKYLAYWLKAYENIMVSKTLPKSSFDYKMVEQLEDVQKAFFRSDSVMSLIKYLPVAMDITLSVKNVDSLEPAASLTFCKSGEITLPDPLSWFKMENLVACQPWSFASLREKTFTTFSYEGMEGIKDSEMEIRRFAAFNMSSSADCGSFYGLLSITEMGSCSWENSPSKVAIVYAVSNSEPANFSTHGIPIDQMQIHVTLKRD